MTERNPTIKQLAISVAIAYADTRTCRQCIDAVLELHPGADEAVVVAMWEAIDAYVVVAMWEAIDAYDDRNPVQ